MRKKIIVFVVCAFLTTLAATADAQNPDEVKIAEVIRLDNERVAALLRGDIEPLKRIYHADYTLVTEDGSVQTKTSRFDAIKSGSMKFEKIEIIDRTPRIAGDTVIMLTREKLTIKRDGKPVGGDVRLTRVYQRLGGQWYLTASHATSIR